MAETKVFKRYVWAGTLPVPVSEGVVTILRNAQGTPDLPALAAQISAAFGGGLKIKSSASKITLHGAFEKLNRTIDVTLMSRGRDFLVVTSFTRTGFYPVVVKDVRELHRLGQGVFSQGSNSAKTVVEIWRGMSELLVASAHAQEDDPLAAYLGFNNLTGPQVGGQVPGPQAPGPQQPVFPSAGMPPFLDTSSLERTMQGQGVNITTTIEREGRRTSETITFQGNQLNTTLNTQGSQLNSTLNQQGDQLNSTLNQQGNQLNSTLNQQGDQLNSTLNRQGDQLNQTAEDLRETLETQGSALNGNLSGLNAQAEFANENWAKSNMLLAKSMDPAHMGKVAFYTAAGAALGAFTMNLAIQGVTKGLGLLLELFTGEKQKRLEWEDFQRAMQVWDTELNELIQMEKTIDSFLAAFKFFKHKDLGTDYPQLLRTAIRGMALDRELFLEKFRDQSLELSCRATYFDAAAELEDKLSEYKSLLALAQGNSAIASDPEAYFCGQLSDLRRKLLGAERSMQNLRLQILVAERQFFDRQRELRERDHSSGQKVGSRWAETRREREQSRERLEREAAKRAEDEHRQWIKACVNGKNQEGQRIRAEYPHSSRERKLACRRGRAPGIGVITTHDPGGEEALRSDLQILANDYVELNLDQQYQQWFTKIHMDAYCYQFSHGSADLPAKCTEFPETLYSTSVTRAYAKADKAYKDSCAERYDQGISALARAKE